MISATFPWIQYPFCLAGKSFTALETGRSHSISQKERGSGQWRKTGRNYKEEASATNERDYMSGSQVAIENAEDFLSQGKPILRSGIVRITAWEKDCKMTDNMLHSWVTDVCNAGFYITAILLKTYTCWEFENASWPLQLVNTPW